MTQEQNPNVYCAPPKNIYSIWTSLIGLKNLCKVQFFFYLSLNSLWAPTLTRHFFLAIRAVCVSMTTDPAHNKCRINEDKLQPYSEVHLFLFIALHLESLQPFLVEVICCDRARCMCDSSGISSPVQCRPNRPHHNRPACQSWHQETWKSLKQLHTSETSFCCGRRGSANISNCLQLYLQLGSGFFSVNACAWNASFHQMKDNTNFHISSCTSLSRGAWVQSHSHKVWSQCPRGILPLNTPKI